MGQRAGGKRAYEKTKAEKPELSPKNGENRWILQFVEPLFYKSTP